MQCSSKIFCVLSWGFDVFHKASLSTTATFLDGNERNVGNGDLRFHWGSWSRLQWKQHWQCVIKLKCLFFLIHWHFWIETCILWHWETGKRLVNNSYWKSSHSGQVHTGVCQVWMFLTSHCHIAAETRICLAYHLTILIRPFPDVLIARHSNNSLLPLNSKSLRMLGLAHLMCLAHHESCPFRFSQTATGSPLSICTASMSHTCITHCLEKWGFT